MQLERGPLLADETLTGAAWCERHSALIDAWLAGLFDGAIEAVAGSADGASRGRGARRRRRLRPIGTVSAK